MSPLLIDSAINTGKGVQYFVFVYLLVGFIQFQLKSKVLYRFFRMFVEQVMKVHKHEIRKKGGKKDIFSSYLYFKNYLASGTLT